jgi:hypothetical protein
MQSNVQLIIDRIRIDTYIIIRYRINIIDNKRNTLGSIYAGIIINYAFKST